MVQESKKQETQPVDEPVQTNLVDIQQASDKESQVLEINKQMSGLETSINKLNRKLNATNKQVKTDVERLSASDAEITDKVAQTYKQLGVIEGTFQELSDQSAKINAELKTVNGTIKTLEKKSRNELDNAIEKQSAINDDFSQIHEQLIDKAENLSKKSANMARKLTKSIKDNGKMLAELEARIVAELEKLAEDSAQRDTQLDDKISSQKAKMLLMQSVDEALEKRAAALEDVSQQLLKDSETLKDSTNVLDVLTSKLSTDVEALELHTTQLAEQNAAQQQQLDQLEDKTDSLGRTLLALASLEKKHFRLLGSASLLLLLAILAAFFYGEYMRDTESAVEAQRNDLVENRISDLQNRVEDEQMASQVFYQEISTLEKTLDSMKGEVAAVTGELNDRLKEMTDQVESMDGRIQYIAPLYNFGDNNTIHGSQWISQLNPAHKSIKVATVADKQDLYDIAQRHNNYFTEELAYFITPDQQYTLIYGGKFDNDQQLENLMRRMPRYIKGQLITPISNAEVLAQIKN